MKTANDLQTLAEAMESFNANKWLNTAVEEIYSLNKTCSIKIVDREKLPKDRKLMKTKWVFKKNYHADGKLDKYWVRCTVKGFTY